VADLSFEELRAVTSGCQVVLLTAADGEASLLERALVGSKAHTVSTKKLVVGDLRGGRPGSTSGCRVALGVSGMDKVNAAHLLTCLLQAMETPPRLVLQVGIGGAIPGGGGFAPASIGDVVLATQEAYSDTGSSSPGGWLSARELGWPIALVEGVESGGVFPVDGRLVTAALAALAAAAAEDAASAALRPEPCPHVLAGPCVTSSLVTGLASDAEALGVRWGALVESMEGAAAAHICGVYGAPFLEVRGISNVVGDRDRASWEVSRAVAASSWAASVIVAALDGLPLAAPGGTQQAPSGTQQAPSGTHQAMEG
jgi:futalosine hydrolase